MTRARGHAMSIPRGHSARRSVPASGDRERQLTPLFAIGAAMLLTLLASDWIAGAGLLVLWLVWFLLGDERGSPVLPLAVSFQWVQVMCGVYYFTFTGRELDAHYASDYRTMVLIGLGCIIALTLGLAMGLKAARLRADAPAPSDTLTVSWRVLFGAYIVSSIANALLREIAWSVPGLTQALIALGYARLGVLFVIFRRLVRHRFRWEWFSGILLFELVLGFTGYFAGFREPLMLAALALIEVFRPRSAAHWLRIFAVAGLMGVAGLMWMGIRSVYRAEIDTGELGGSRVERLGRIGELSSEWFGSETGPVTTDVDKLVDRLWAIYYPALAVSRVPEVLPHENGAILRSALKHIVTPRILFPDKGALLSDSEKVRKYSGVFVASTEENTTIAFGYAAESYVDFGMPWMFLPSVLFGIVMGAAYRYVFRVIYHHELAVGLATVVFWLSLYLFERSWVRTLGITVTLLIVVGALGLVLDRSLLRWRAKKRFRETNASRRQHRPTAVGAG